MFEQVFFFLGPIRFSVQFHPQQKYPYRFLNWFESRKALTAHKRVGQLIRAYLPSPEGQIGESTILRKRANYKNKEGGINTEFGNYMMEDWS